MKDLLLSIVGKTSLDFMFCQHADYIWLASHLLFTESLLLLQQTAWFQQKILHFLAVKSKQMLNFVLKAS